MLSVHDGQVDPVSVQEVTQVKISIAPRYKKAIRAFLQRLLRDEIPFALGGAFAVYHYTGLWRDTKDMDIFLLPADADRAVAAAQKLGYNAWIQDRHWLAKARTDGYLIDMIYGGGNWLGQVTVDWLRRARPTNLFGLDLKVLAPEEMIWSKAYVAHRERYDGADVLHLIRYASEQIDWQHLLNRFSAHPNLLLSYVALFSFAYPWETHRIPEDVMRQLTEGLLDQRRHPRQGDRVCWGMLLDPRQFAYDVEVGGCSDPREILAAAQETAPEEVRREREEIWQQHQRGDD